MNTTLGALAFIATAVLAGLLVSPRVPVPVTAGTPEPERHAWTRDRVVLAGLAAAFAALATHGQPRPAWWLFAVGGAALCLTDIRSRRIPRTWLYPLAAAVAGSLLAAAVLHDQMDHLARAAAGGLIVAGTWLAIAIISPSSVGLGDVRLAGLTGAITAWIGWTAILEGQLAAMLLALVIAIPIALTSGTTWNRKRHCRWRRRSSPAH